LGLDSGGKRGQRDGFAEGPHFLGEIERRGLADLHGSCDHFASGDPTAFFMIIIDYPKSMKQTPFARVLSMLAVDLEPAPSGGDLGVHYTVKTLKHDTRDQAAESFFG
jgi:hypothetical protein